MADKNYGNDLQLAELVKYISDEMKFPIMGAGGGYAPIGTINFFDATTAPLGWLACDGSIHNISDYPDLATFYASQHGSSNYYGGNGTTTFAVPNLQGEFLRGAGTNGHTNQGNGGSVGQHQNATEMPNIRAGGSDLLFPNTMTEYVPATNMDATNPKNYSTSANKYISFANGTIPISNFKSFTSRPTNTSFLICVKATLSDAEINAFDVYTPREHQVAWWEEEIDGVWKRKPVYERTVQFYKNNAPASGWNNSSGRWYYTDFTANFFDLLLDTRILIQDASGNLASDLTLAKSSTFDITWYADGYFTLNFSTNYNNWFVLTYTKTTDDWQTS